jgi:hypothetical protein
LAKLYTPDAIKRRGNRLIAAAARRSLHSKAAYYITADLELDLFLFSLSVAQNSPNSCGRGEFAYL